MKFTPFTWAKSLYGSIMDLLGFIVAETSDKSADIASRALPILAPLPNAISVFYVSQTALGFTPAQAIAFSASMECALFAMIEVCLMLFDGYDEDPNRYEKPFKLVAWSTLGVMLVTILFVVFVELSQEKGHPIMAALPLLSMFSAVGLAFRRWHLRNMQAGKVSNKIQQELDRARAELETVLKQFNGLQNQLETVQKQSDQVQNELDAVLNDKNELIDQLDEMKTQLDKFTPASILSSLDESNRQKFVDLLNLVSSNRVTAPADLVELGVGKSDAYPMFRAAVMSRLIYKNGDGAFHAVDFNPGT